MIYRASPVKRDRRTMARLEALDQQILLELEADHPQSVRHLFYRMTDPRVAEESERALLHSLASQLVDQETRP